jgi:uncharacterized protein DUF4255
MANLFAIHSVGNSVVTFLRNSYPDSLRTAHPCEFRLLSSGEVAAEPVDMPTTLSLLLFRVTVNDHLRNTGRTGDGYDVHVPLSLDLHYLLTVWASNALAEHSILAWAMRQLQLRPVLDFSTLSPEAGWDLAETVQLVPTDLTTDEIMRLWDALKPGYRLSVAYVARVVRIDGEPEPDAPPVVATRFSWTDREAQP